MTIYKGNDFEFHFGISPCFIDVDPSLIRNLQLDIFTAPGSTAIRKDISDIEISGEIGTVHLEWEELEALEDGVIRYKLDYFYEGEEISFERATNLYLKTPINYQPTTFITEAEAEQMIEDAVSGITVQAYYITRENRETVGADIWARYSAYTAEEVAAMPITIRSYYGTNLVCVRKENDSLVFAGSVEASNGSYWTTYYCEYGMKATGTTFGEHSWTTPITLKADTTTHDLYYSESPLGWAGIARALCKGASINIMTIDKKSNSLYVMADDVKEAVGANDHTFTLYAEFIHLNTKIEAAWRMEQQQVSCTKWVETPLV